MRGAGWTMFGVADPTAGRPLVPLGHEHRRGLGALVVDRTVEDRAFGGTGPAAGGSSGGGVGVGVGLGKTGGGGLGKAGNGGSDTPAGTYSSAAPFEMHWPSSLQSRPPALRTVPSSRSVNERAIDAPDTLEAIVVNPVRGSYTPRPYIAPQGQAPDSFHRDLSSGPCHPTASPRSC